MNSTVAFQQTTGTRIVSSQCHNSLVFAARQIPNNRHR